MTTATAALQGVEKHYKKFTLGPIDLVVPSGSIVGLVGENGAGKTTTLKILTGVTRPDAGRVELLGSRPEDPAARARVGVVFEDATFFMGMTPAQIGRCMAGMFQAAWQTDHYEALLERFGLDPRQKMKEFSRGMRMKLNLAAALAHAPELLVLDEPTAGLDPVMRGEILDLFLEYIQDERHSILLSSHITSDLEQVADSIAYLHKGRLLFQEDKDRLLEEYGVLHCSEADLSGLPAGVVVATRRGAFGCESLVKERQAVCAALPRAVCDPAKIDDIMRFTAGRDEK